MIVQVHYQLKFDILQASYSYVNYDMTEVENNLTVAENLVDGPSKDRSLVFCQGNVKLSNLI